ncbi:MAG: hypothetical protein KJO69_10430 [Gammaproteobacteria bacterium]|nr:hypothetical protein [Gammaproteobacteria bacterium]
MKAISLVIGVLLLTGCSWFKPDTIIVASDPIDTCVAPPEATSIFLEDVKFSVVIDELGLVWVATTSTGYEKLSKNMQLIIQNMKEKNAIIDYYKECHKEKPEENVGN